MLTMPNQHSSRGLQQSFRLPQDRSSLTTPSGLTQSSSLSVAQPLSFTSPSRTTTLSRPASPLSTGRPVQRPPSHEVLSKGQVDLRQPINPPTQPYQPVPGQTQPGIMPKPQSVEWNGTQIIPGVDFNGWISSKNGVLTEYATREEAEAAGGDFAEPNFLRYPAQNQGIKTGTPDANREALITALQQIRK